MNEKELQRLVLLLARTHGWNVAHFGNSVKYVKRGSGYIAIPDKDATGFPDLVMVREGQLIFAELKSEKGRIRDEQALWFADLMEVVKLGGLHSNVQVWLWRPVDWDNGTIQEVLT